MVIICHRFSHVHASFWFGNRTMFYSVPVSGTRRIRSQICMTHVPETGAGVNL